jgi:hypothetical protein
MPAKPVDKALFAGNIARERRHLLDFFDSGMLKALAHTEEGRADASNWRRNGVCRLS